MRMEMQVLVLCAIALIGVVSSAPGRFEVRTFTKGTVTASPVAAVQTTLDAGWKILGGGATAAEKTENFITASYPVDSSTWYARVTTGIFNYSSTVTLYVVAIYDPQDELDYQIIEDMSEIADHPQTYATVDKGYTLTGGGVLSNSVGAGNFVVSAYPSTTTTWNVESKDHIIADPTQVFAFAIGIKPKNTSISIISSIHSSTSSSGRSPSASIIPSTNSGFVSGGGAKVVYTGSGNMLWKSAPILDSAGKTTGWTASSHDDRDVDHAKVTAYAVSIKITA